MGKRALFGGIYALVLIGTFGYSEFGPYLLAVEEMSSIGPPHPKKNPRTKAIVVNVSKGSRLWTSKILATSFRRSVVNTANK